MRSRPEKTEVLVIKKTYNFVPSRLHIITN